jgi:hypothetical protein
MVKPKYTGFMAGWAVFLGFYQIFLAGQHGGLFLGKSNLVALDLPTTALTILYTVTGLLALSVAYGIWTMRWWALPFGFLLQGMVIAVAVEGIIRWAVLGQPSPIAWDALDLAFAAFNLSWALSRDVRSAFGAVPIKTKSNDQFSNLQNNQNKSVEELK